MSTKTTVICDINDCGEKSYSTVDLMIKFLTDKNGQKIKPYLSMRKVDFCERHYNEMFDLTAITATSIKGNVNYALRAPEES